MNHITDFRSTENHQRWQIAGGSEWKHYNLLSITGLSKELYCISSGTTTATLTKDGVLEMVVLTM